MKRYKYLKMILVMILAFLSGCESKSRLNPFSAEIMANNGTERLALVYIPDGSGPVTNSQSYVFNSLAWERKVGKSWQVRFIITKQQFQAGGTNERWIAAIHSFDPVRGTAIIKVAEVLPQTTNGIIACQYSWREWNLSSNAEIKFLRICKEPFEPFNGNRIKLRK